MSRVEPIRDLAEEHRIEVELSKLTTPRGRRMFLMWELGVFLGLRISDLIRLKVGEIRGRPTLEIREKKTRKKAILTISPQLREVVRVRCAGMDDDDYLLQSQRRGPDGRPMHITRERAYVDVQEIKRLTNVKVPMGCHTMRKTFGYQVYQEHKDVAWLMDWFNHSSEAVTLIYIGITADNRKRVTDRMPFRDRAGIQL